MNEHIVIGELSAPKLFAPTLFFVAVGILQGDSGGPDHILNAVGFAIATFLFAVISYCRPVRGLYIQDGQLHESIMGGRKPVDDIRLACRTTCRGSWFRTLIRVEMGLTGAPPTPGAIRIAPKGCLYVPTTFYKTPSATMLDRLSEHGIRIVGSRTKLLDLF